MPRGIVLLVLTLPKGADHATRDPKGEGTQSAVRKGAKQTEAGPAPRIGVQTALPLKDGAGRTAVRPESSGEWIN